MFDFFAHWFAKTINKGEAAKIKTHYKNGHFSLDLTFIVIILVICILFYFYRKYQNYLTKKYKNYNINRNLELQPMNNPVYNPNQSINNHIV